MDNFAVNHIGLHSMLRISIKQIKTSKRINILSHNVLMLAVKSPIRKKTCMDIFFSMSCSFWGIKAYNQAVCSWETYNMMKYAICIRKIHIAGISLFWLLNIEFMNCDPNLLIYMLSAVCLIRMILETIFQLNSLHAPVEFPRLPYYDISILLILNLLEKHIHMCTCFCAFEF